jgi:hypothetical protein
MDFPYLEGSQRIMTAHVEKILLPMILVLCASIIQAQVILEKATAISGQKLGFLIMGTIAQKTPVNNVALVKVIGTGAVVAVKIGLIIDNKYKVTDVSEKYIRVVTRKSEKYLVFLDKFSSDFASAVNHVQGPAINPDGDYHEEGFERKRGLVSMTGAFRDNLVKNELSKILMQATAEPVIVGGQMIGFRMYQIDTDSIFTKAGIRDDDIITSLNGIKLGSIASAISTLKSLKDSGSIEVEYKRAGEAKSIAIDVN